MSYLQRGKNVFTEVMLLLTFALIQWISYNSTSQGTEQIMSNYAICPIIRCIYKRETLSGSNKNMSNSTISNYMIATIHVIYAHTYLEAFAFRL